MSNYDLTKDEMKWLMEELSKEITPVKENCGCGQDPCKTYGPQDNTNMTIAGEMDHEVSMARTQLDKAAKYSQSMSARMEQIGEQNLPAWVQAKITKASDYISKVYHYMEKYLGEDTGMMQESAEGKINKASHDIEIDVSISKSDMKKLHDGETVTLNDTSGNNTFKVNIKSD